MAQRSRSKPDRDSIVMDVVQDVVSVSVSSSVSAVDGSGLQTKAAGFILTKGGLRIIVK